MLVRRAEERETSSNARVQYYDDVATGMLGRPLKLKARNFFPP